VRKSTAPVDAFHYVYQPLLGDGTITAREWSVCRAAPATSLPRVMIAETLNPQLRNAKTADWTALRRDLF